MHIELFEDAPGKSPGNSGFVILGPESEITLESMTKKSQLASQEFTSRQELQHGSTKSIPIDLELDDLEPGSSDDEFFKENNPPSISDSESIDIMHESQETIKAHGSNIDLNTILETENVDICASQQLEMHLDATLDFIGKSALQVLVQEERQGILSSQEDLFTPELVVKASPNNDAELSTVIEDAVMETAEVHLDQTDAIHDDHAATEQNLDISDETVATSLPANFIHLDDVVSIRPDYDIVPHSPVGSNNATPVKSAEVFQDPKIDRVTPRRGIISRLQQMTSDIISTVAKTTGMKSATRKEAEKSPFPTAAVDYRTEIDEKLVDMFKKAAHRGDEAIIDPLFIPASNAEEDAQNISQESDSGLAETQNAKYPLSGNLYQDEADWVFNDSENDTGFDKPELGQESESDAPVPMEVDVIPNSQNSISNVLDSQEQLIFEGGSGLDIAAEAAESVNLTLTPDAPDEPWMVESALFFEEAIETAILQVPEGSSIAQDMTEAANENIIPDVAGSSTRSSTANYAQSVISEPVLAGLEPNVDEAISEIEAEPPENESGLYAAPTGNAVSVKVGAVPANFVKFGGIADFRDYFLQRNTSLLLKRNRDIEKESPRRKSAKIIVTDTVDDEILQSSRNDGLLSFPGRDANHPIGSKLSSTEATSAMPLQDDMFAASVEKATPRKTTACAKKPKDCRIVTIDDVDEFVAAGSNLASEVVRETSTRQPTESRESLATELFGSAELPIDICDSPNNMDAAKIIETSVSNSSGVDVSQSMNLEENGLLC